MKTIVTERLELVDRTGWDAGPWDDEPDKIQWQDEQTRLPCMVIRNHMGAWCGYVGVPPTHPWYEKGCGEIDAAVHGGLTYSDRCREDCPICHEVGLFESDDVWWVGFDCAHAGDIIPRTAAVEREFAMTVDWEVYRDLAYVQNEVRGLAKQAQEVTVQS